MGTECGGEYLGAKREEIKEGWRKMHIGKLHNIYYSFNIIRVIKSRRMRSADNRVRMGKSKGKIQLGSPRHRWEENMTDIRTRELG
jgi:hypothetical protein